MVDGRATSMLFNPERVGGLPVTEGPSGPRPNAPEPEGTVEYTDDGPMDRLALLAVNDIQEFWAKNYANYLPGEFEPVDTLASYDSSDPCESGVVRVGHVPEPQCRVLLPAQHDDLGPRCLPARRAGVFR